jgi:hypothetical protein
MRLTSTEGLPSGLIWNLATPVAAVFTGGLPVKVATKFVPFVDNLTGIVRIAITCN